MSFARRWWRPLVGELLSTALLVLLGVAATLPVVSHSVAADNNILKTPQPVAHAALAFGFVVVVLIQVFGPVSGAHMNPAVTLAAVLQSRLEPLPALLYLGAQIAGSLIGFGALVSLAGEDAAAPPAGVTLPASGVSAPAAAAIEALLTGLLCLLACALWAAHDAARPDASAPIKFGLAVAGLVYSGAVMTGASINPVRSFAPAVIQNVWSHHWVYWVGPLVGAGVAAMLHRLVLQPECFRGLRPRNVHTSREEVGLQEKVQDHC